MYLSCNVHTVIQEIAYSLRHGRRILFIIIGQYQGDGFREGHLIIKELFRNDCLAKVIVKYEKAQKDTEVVADGNRSESLTINQRRRQVFGMLGATAALAIPVLAIPGCGGGGDTNSGGGGGSSNLTGFRGNGSSSIEFP